MTHWLERRFRLTERGTTVGTEFRAGLATFLTMAYILFVNPQILSQAGMPPEDVTLATALAAALATLLMGILANYPIGLAPGMGLNAYFTFSVVLGMGVSYQVALAAVFIEGVLFLLLTVAGIRSAVIGAIPASLKTAVMSGIGLFLTLIGFHNAGISVGNPETLVGLGEITSASALLALSGLILISVLLVRRILGAMLIGIVAVTVIAWIAGVSPVPERLFSVPAFPDQTLLAFDFTHLLDPRMVTVVIAFLFVDFFDTAGTLIGIGQLGGFIDEKGELPRAEQAFAADALGTMAGALLGTSTVTSYVESATGVEEGGRTGLTAIVIAALFLLALFFTPVFTAVPAFATAPALIVVGALMMQGTRNIDWGQLDEAIPAFLTIATMPFTYSIANGIVLGVISYVFVKLLSGKYSEVHPLLYGLAALLLLYYALAGPA